MNVKILVLGVFFSIDGQELSESLMATRCAEETWKKFRPCWKLLQDLPEVDCVKCYVKARDLTYTFCFYCKCLKTM